MNDMENMGNKEGMEIHKDEHYHHFGVSQIVIAIVVLIILLGVGLWLQHSIDTGRTVEEIKPGQVLTRVGTGRVIENFPQEFLIEADAGVAESYSIEYQDKNVTQPVVRYTSALSLAENVLRFGALLEENGWEVVNEADADASGVTFFYATRGDE